MKDDGSVCEKSETEVNFFFIFCELIVVFLHQHESKARHVSISSM